MTKGADTMERNRYKVINRQPGPRGFHSAQGVKMFDPALEGSDAGEVVELSDDELSLAEGIGLEVTPLEEGDEGSGITDGLQTPDLPAEGQFNPNSPTGAQVIEDYKNPTDPSAPIDARKAPEKQPEPRKDR